MQATVLAPTTSMDKKAWLSLRNRGIGGSDAAAACGLSRLWVGIELFMIEVI